VNTLDKRRLLEELKDPESRRLFYSEHISTALPIQIRELRKGRGLTQKQLSDLTGFSQSNLSDFENPNYEYTPQIGTLKRLADAFDVPVIVRFGSWDELWDWEMTLSPRKLAPQTFDKSLPRLEKSVARSEATSSGAVQTKFDFDNSNLKLIHSGMDATRVAPPHKTTSEQESPVGTMILVNAPETLVA
jgi:transcriptional regulator with XRE-family HTH domain